MKIRLNLTQKFLGPTLAVLVLFGVSLNYQANSILRREAIGNAKNIIVDFVRIQSKQHVTSLADFSLADPSKTDQVFRKLLEEVKLPDVIRIKVWDRDGTIIFADDKSIVGKNFKDNKDFQKAIGGEVAADIKAPLKAENIAEKGYKQLMEVYVPIKLQADEGPVGVVETYYKLDSLNASILKVQREISLVIASGFLLLAIILWLLIRFMVVRPLKELEIGITGLKESENKIK